MNYWIRSREILLHIGVEQIHDLREPSSITVYHSLVEIRYRIFVAPFFSFLNSTFLLFILTVTPCERKPCKNNANCTDDGVKCFHCVCPDGFKGFDCSERGI